MITLKQYSTLDKAFEYFNAHLFNHMLPDCIITLNRKKHTRGYFHKDKFRIREKSDAVSEISLNPDEFLERTDLEILSTLVHEMCHLLQYTIGDPPPSSTGEPGGKTAGQKMTHYILKGGRFEIVAQGFLISQGGLLVESLPEPEKEKKEKKKTRYKFVCPECGMAAWAKESANLACGNCREVLIKEEEEDDV
jgi:predicted SprT family Zn-dependent metalloprotease